MPPVSDAELMKQFLRERKATFVSCWQKSEYESWLMWKQYCRKEDGCEGGGVALQTTMKRLWVTHQTLFEKHKDLFLKHVDYLDHWTDSSVSHTVPIQVFLKPVWFLDEKEIRLALFRGSLAYGGTEEQSNAALAQLKDHELIEVNLCDLCERIVLNPFSSDEQKAEISDLIKNKRRELESRLHESGIASKPLLPMCGDCSS